jgi:hypothetical protein
MLQAFTEGNTTHHGKERVNTTVFGSHTALSGSELRMSKEDHISDQSPGSVSTRGAEHDRDYGRSEEPFRNS